MNLIAHAACTAYTFCMQMTIRNIPKAVRERLVSEAKKRDISLNQAALEALADGLQVTMDGKPKWDFSMFTMSAEERDAILKSVAESDAADLAARAKEERRENRNRHKSLRRPRKRSA